MTEHISCDCKCKFNTTICNSNKKWNNKTCQCECKHYRKCKKVYSWNPSTCICENSKYLKSIADNAVTECDEFVIVMDTVSTKKTNTLATKRTNTIATNVGSTASINSHSKKSKRLLYFAYSLISDHITIDNYYYLLLCKTRRHSIK